MTLPDPKLRHFFAFLFLTGTSIFAVWVVTGSWMPKTDLELGLVGAFFVCAPAGGLWMLYDCFRQRNTPFAYFLLSFVPYGFVFYYFERVRPRKRTMSSVATNEQHPPAQTPG